MKTEFFLLVSDQVRQNIVDRLNEFLLDGSVKVTFSTAKYRSNPQLSLLWMWCTEVAKAGIGGKHEDTKEGVYLITKWRWVLPVLIRDDDFFADLYTMWKLKYGSDTERMLYFIDSQVHTSSLNQSQMSEVLDSFEKHYSKYVNLTNPNLYGLKT